jgi:hypothetical protein
LPVSTKNGSIRDAGVQDREAHHVAFGRRELDVDIRDADIAVADPDGLLDGVAGGVDFQQHVAAERGDARVAGLDRDAQVAGDAGRQEHEAAPAAGEIHAQHAGVCLRDADAHRLDPARERDLLEGEVAAQLDQRRAVVRQRDQQRARQPQERALVHLELRGDRVAAAVKADEEGLIDGWRSWC